MKDFDIVHFYPSSEMFDKASKIFDAEKKALEILIPYADIQWAGSCSIPGAIGKFDVDVQVRVPQESFEDAMKILQNNYSEKHKDFLWSENVALFSLGEVDYILTVIDSPQDDFYRVRDYFKNNPDALKEYNELKMRYEGKPYHEYRKAKNEFLGPNGATRFLDY